MVEFVAVGSYTSMSKGKAMAGGSTSHTPCMARRGWHDESSDGCGKSVLPLQRVKNYSNSRVLGYGQLERTARSYVQVLETIWVLKEKNEVEYVLCNYADGLAWVVGDKLDHDETWSGKRRSFGEINKMVIFRENFLKRDILLFFKQKTAYEIE